MRSETSNSPIQFKTSGPIVTILGSGAAIPQTDRNAPGLLLTDRQNKLTYMIDCGSGSTQQVVRTGIPYTQITHLFLSHLHPDHTAELPALLQALALDTPPHVLEIFGPIGTKFFCQTIVQTLFPLLETRVSFNVTEVEEGCIVIGSNWDVMCTQVEHFGLNALAYRFKFNNRIMVYSGDTAPCESLKRLSVNANLLIHECSILDDASEELFEGHSSPSQVAELARDCKVEKLCLTHFYPEVARRTNKILKQVQTEYNGKIILARDLLQIAI